MRRESILGTKIKPLSLIAETKKTEREREREKGISFKLASVRVM